MEKLYFRVKEPFPLSSGIEESRTTLTPPMTPLGINGGALASMGPRLGTRDISLCPNRRKYNQIKTIINEVKAKNSRAQGKRKWRENLQGNSYRNSKLK